MKSKIFSNAHNSAISILDTGFSIGLAAILMAGIPSAGIAQQTTAHGASTASIVDSSLPGSFASISRGPSMANTLHVTLGHSIFIDTKHRLRRVYIADPAVITSATMSPTQIVVTAMNPGICSLTLLDETGQAQSFVISSDLDIDGLRAAMAQAMHGEPVKVEGGGARVTLTGLVSTSAVSDAAAKLAGLYSKDVANALVVAPSHPKQVRLQVRILEVDRSKILQLGLNLFSPGGNSNFLASSTSALYPTSSTLGAASAAGQLSTLTTSNPLNFLLYSAKLNLGATIEDLESKQVLQILAEPTITAISGETANFLSGGEFPFPVVQPGGSGTAPVISIQFRAFGVKLEFTPVVNEDGTIRLKVAPEVSALDYSNAVSVSGVTIPALSTRRAQTEVELRSNQSFAISGLLDQRTTDIMSKNPGAASIPILGALFKSKSVNHSNTELVVVVTPTVVDPLSEATEPEQPGLPIPTLDTKSFDKSLGKDLSPKLTAPPINPDRPHFGNEPVPPATAAPSATPTAGSAGSDAPSQTPADATIARNPATDPYLAAFATPGSQDRTSGRASSSSGKASQEAKPGSGSMVEIMALSHESDAEVMVEALRRHGYDAVINHTRQDSLLHLDVGPFPDKNAAESMRQKLLLDGYNATIK